jgi:hypothetical protein
MVHRQMTIPTMLAVLAAFAPAIAPAYPVVSPINGRVYAVASYPYNQAYYHNAVDITGGSCGSTGVLTAIDASISWTVVIRHTDVLCYGGHSVSPNEAYHTFSNGYTFRQQYFNKSANSYSRTCDRCSIGTIFGTYGGMTDPYVHMQMDKLGTKSTSWYSGMVSVGENVTTTTTIGYTERVY